MIGDFGKHHKKKALGILWHEGINGRKDEDITSCYKKLFFSGPYRDYKIFVIWVDNCGGQNKCWTLYTTLVLIVNLTHVEKITIKYFVVGHSYMSADNFHRSVEKEMKEMEKVFNFEDFIQCVGNVGSVHVMTPTDFHSFKDGLSQGAASKRSRPLLADVQMVEFRKGSNMMFYKNSTNDDEPFKEADFLQAKYKKPGQQFPATLTENRGISQKKKDVMIKKLKSVIPSDYMPFYHLLTVNNESIDLASEREPSIESI